MTELAVHAHLQLLPMAKPTVINGKHVSSVFLHSFTSHSIVCLSLHSIVGLYDGLVSGLAHDDHNSISFYRTRKKRNPTVTRQSDKIIPTK